MHKPSLSELQRWLRWIVTDPRGVASALADPNPKEKSARYQAPALNGQAWIAVGPPLSLVQRLDIYAEAYFSRLVEALEGIFPRTRALLGEEQMAVLVAEYLKVAPSKSPDIQEAGRGLPAFAEGYFVSTEFESLTALLAAEWAALQSFLEIPAKPLELSALVGFSDEDWARLRFDLTPALRILETKWDLLQLWQGQRPVSPAAAAAATAAFCLREYKLERLLPFEKALLAQIRDGRSLGEMIADVGVLATPTEVTATFGRWVQDGMITAFS